ncbi:2-(1,2-epoxy-1,2-dihydrophenyl)acetyl-CoA isomerase [Thalassobacillus devorans]|uniref:2-(1,2-epoxy-1,2-dihydrophenyl)acetyl-CoA isomerase n=1 Tax=Thalassobacillus devorans TaxID=279813 RepID=A0ABQ1PPY6_9BACI|nr:enoyl-CoA hydratase-related protein [Thalassobacillus devorans]NIK30373.1 2-(1,2-epoxy-1,2-dihydrophenyl)acetyl-CoA isomerase [Thalassobacillus devorans]GGD00768.1 2-(1,2-epoxy-1,2-dihydrophenyl)acetyl-CoA isomerase [Thalassobacillus devorans]
MFETINYQIHNNIAWITLNRPDKLNAFIGQMNKEVQQAVKQADKDDNVRCLVITGEGRAFCSGQDLSEVNEETNLGDIIRAYYGPMIKEIARCDKPIVAALNGVAAGAGMSLALACDFRIASEKASMVEAFIHVGLIPDAGNLYYLPRLVGHAKALELAILGEKITAEEAKEFGLVTKVVPEGSLEKEVEQFAVRLAAMPTKAIQLIKRNLKESWSMELDDYLEKEAQGQRIAGLTADYKEGVEAFLQKRKPEFSGK